MFCPKCGKENPDDGSFCRKCGNDLSGITGATEKGRLVAKDQETGKVNSQSSGPDEKHKKKKKENSWEGAMIALFSGIAFLVIAVVLAFQPMGAGWWFWMFIPGFMMIGLGVAQVIGMQKEGSKQTADFSSGQNQIESADQLGLPPKKTTYVSEYEQSRHDTDEAVQPSVTEGTTRRLEFENEAKSTKSGD